MAPLSVPSKPPVRPSGEPPDPAHLRSIFGQNLRHLASMYPSVAGLCREMGLNRTQFNRYLAGESFPRPDILHRICQFFGVDARVLLEPIARTRHRTRDVLSHPALEGFLDARTIRVPQSRFPSGFYRFLRRSFIGEEDFVQGLVHVSRRDGHTLLRGYDPRDAAGKQGPALRAEDREFRGLVMRQEEGVMAIVNHRGALGCSFNFLTPETAFQSNLWEGYATRAVRERVTGCRAVRMIYEHLGNDLAAALAAARGAGLIPVGDIPRHHRRLLQIGRDFR